VQGISSHWAFTSILLAYSGVTDPTNTTDKCRAELLGILTSIYILYRTEQENPPSTPTSATIQCSSKQAMHEAFRESPLGVSTAIHPHHNLIMEIRFLRNLLKTQLKPFLGANHKTEVTEQPSSTPILDYKDFLAAPTIANTETLINELPQSHVITVLFNGQPLRRDLTTVINELEYAQPLRQKLLKDNDWTEDQLHSIDWESFQKAIRKILRSHRISISKLSHQLWNTNVQNNKFYGETALCPICTTIPETIHHIYQCCHSSAKAHFTECLKSLENSLRPTTPRELTEHIIAALKQWNSGIKPISPTKGSRLPAHLPLNEAWTTQEELGWDAFARGHISIHWREAFQTLHRPKKTSSHHQHTATIDKWTSSLIRLLWTFSEKIWQFRNSVVHGKLEEFHTSKSFCLLQEQVTNLYDQFIVDPHMLPQSRAHLSNKPITSIIAMDKDSISSWISSIKEAVHTREHREKLALEQLKCTLHAFFKKRDTNRNSSKTSIWTAPFSAKYYSNI
jgi:hypothetical protein